MVSVGGGGARAQAAPERHRSVHRTALSAAEARLAFAGLLHERRSPAELWVGVDVAEEIGKLVVMQVVWGRHAVSHYVVGDGGATLTARKHGAGNMNGPRGCAALGAEPMAVGGGGVYYAEVELLQLGHVPIFIGLGRPVLEVEQEHALRGDDFWGIKVSDSRAIGMLGHAGGFAQWGQIDPGSMKPDGKAAAGFGVGEGLARVLARACWDSHVAYCSGEKNRSRKGDTLGLLLDSVAGTLTIYKKGAECDVIRGTNGGTVGTKGWDRCAVGMTRVGLAAEGLTETLCWAVALQASGQSVRMTAKPPPLGWRVDAAVSDVEAAALRGAKVVATEEAVAEALAESERRERHERGEYTSSDYEDDY